MPLGFRPLASAPLAGYLSTTFVSHQYASPASDIALNGYLPSSGVVLYAMLSEFTADDSNYVYSPPNPTTEQFEVKLQAMPDPLSSGDHAVSVRLTANKDTNWDIDLVQGTTILDSWTENVLASAGLVTRTRTFTGTVADSITDYTDLRLRFLARA